MPNSDYNSDTYLSCTENIDIADYDHCISYFPITVIDRDNIGFSWVYGGGMVPGDWGISWDLISESTNKKQREYTADVDRLVKSQASLGHTALPRGPHLPMLPKYSNINSYGGHFFQSTIIILFIIVTGTSLVLLHYFYNRGKRTLPCVTSLTSTEDKKFPAINISSQFAK